MRNLTVTRRQCQEIFRAGEKTGSSRRAFGITILWVNVCLAHYVEKCLMDAGIIGEFGMESGSHRSSLPDGYGSSIGTFGGEDFDALAHVDNLGSADEDHFQRGIAGL